MQHCEASVSYPESPDEELRRELAVALEALATVYGKIAEKALRRKDRHAVYNAVKQERAAYEAARKAALGLTRF